MKYITLYATLEDYKDEIELLKSKTGHFGEAACFISELHCYEEHFYNVNNLDLVKEKYKSIIENFPEYDCALCYIGGYTKVDYAPGKCRDGYVETYFILVTNGDISNDIFRRVRCSKHFDSYNYKIISIDNIMSEYWR